MKNQNSELEARQSATVGAIESLKNETAKLAKLSDEPGVKREEVEGFLAALIQIIAVLAKTLGESRR